MSRKTIWTEDEILAPLAHALYAGGHRPTLRGVALGLGVRWADVQARVQEGEGGDWVELPEEAATYVWVVNQNDRPG